MNSPSDKLYWRYDASELAPFQRDPDTGFASGRMTATHEGVIAYRLKDGTIRRELRRAEVLERALPRFKRLVITDGHHGLVTASNAERLQRGHLGSDAKLVRQDGLAAIDVDYTITVGALADSILERGRTATSTGYRVKVENKPGVWHGPRGAERYDAEVVEIYPNHQAVNIAAGRAERAHMRADSAYPDAIDTEAWETGIRLDEGDGVALREDSTPAIPPAQETTMKRSIALKHTGGAVEVEPHDANILLSELKLREDALDATTRERDDLRRQKDAAEGRAAALEKENAELKATRQDSADIASGVAEMFGVIDGARKLGVPLDGADGAKRLDELVRMGPAKARRQVLSALREDGIDDKASDDYVSGVFAQKVKSAGEKKAEEIRQDSAPGLWSWLGATGSNASGRRSSSAQASIDKLTRSGKEN